MSRHVVLTRLTRHTDDLRSAYRRGGEGALQREIAAVIESVPRWTDIPLRVGVIGRSGVGKSSFLNAIRRLDDEEELGAAGDQAEVGVVETTRRARDFRHPLNPDLVLCDLPGAGTSEFPLETYIRDHRIRFRTFDAVIVMFHSRFTESEVHFLLSVLSAGMLCLFVRTKVALDMDNERKAKRRYFTSHPQAEAELVNRIRRDCEDNLSSLPGPVPVFLIDNFEHDNELLDFAALSDHMTVGFASLKKEAFVKMATHDVMR